MSKRNNRIPVYLSDAEKRDYTKLAQAHNRSLTAMIRELLADSYAKYETDQSAKVGDKDDSPQITAVELVFENVESYAVPMRFIKNFNLGGLKRSLDVNNYDKQAKAKPNYDLFADSLSMSVDPQGLDAIMVGQDGDQYAISGNSVEMLLQRIVKFNDIAAVDVLYADGSHQYVNVYWGNFGDSMNTAMRCRKDFDGNLAISINANNDYDPYAKAKTERDAQNVQAKLEHKAEELLYDFQHEIYGDWNDHKKGLR